MRERLRTLRAAPGVRATVLARRPLVYDDGPDASLDRPAHVRAASGVVAIDRALVVVQDDAHFLGVVQGGRVSALPLPAGPGGLRLFGKARGNKKAKLDLEALFVLDRPTRALVALGSGSMAARERIVVVPWEHGPGEARIVEAPALYAALRASLPGVALNVEGAALDDRYLRVLQRGNGLGATDALLDVDRRVVEALASGEDPGVVEVAAIERLELGALDGVRLTPTDVAARVGRLLFTAAAEASPDTIEDGVVTGAAVAWIDGDDAGWAPLVDVDGAPLAEKIEGIAPGDAPDEVWLVTDADDPDRPAELLRVRLEVASNDAPGVTRPGRHRP